MEALRSGFQLTESNAVAIASICVHLEGVLLAVELAAARSKLLSPKALLSHLEHGTKMLHGGGKVDAPDHQRDLYSIINWSYDLLTVNAKIHMPNFGTT